MQKYSLIVTISSGRAFVALFSVLFVHICGCVSEEDVVLERNQLSELYSKGVFKLQSVQHQRCLSTGQSGLFLDDCEKPTKALLWKWVSRHRLFSLGTNLCLGINTTNGQLQLGMFECDVSLRTMWWRCNGRSVYGASQLKLTVSGEVVGVKRVSTQQWMKYDSAGEGPCAYPYEDIHTLLGNAHGMSCALPFKYNNKWYWECTAEGREDQHRWCATTSRYDQDEKWGFCPNPESGCETFWESNQELGACYQFNLYTILTWSQALTSCQAQGGSLLSITHLSEQNYIRDRLADSGVMVWIGLNHLGEGEGWQWSDGSPLALINFTSGLSPGPRHANLQCGVYNSGSGGQQWQSLSCESALPYICKKSPNNSRKAEPLDNWQYRDTVCPDGWLDHNGICYRVLEEPKTWENSSNACKALTADLTSIHSLSELELLLSLLSNVSSQEIWIGLYKPAGSPTVEWSDGSLVTLTLWHQQEPSHRHGNTQNCVKANRKDGTWLLAECDERLPAVCQTSGLIPLHPTGERDQGCPEGWKRKGHSCYTITSREQTFQDASKGYYCKAPLVNIENRFEQAFLNSLINELGGSDSQYYWTALQDQDNKGEYQWLTQNGSLIPATYTNWNRHQPVSAGGCVVMTGGQVLGHWEVKNCKSHKALSVCKQTVSGFHDDLIPLPHIDSFAPCPKGWESHPGLLHCYKVYHSEKVLMKRSWTEADWFCQALGAALASFHHYEDQIFIQKLLTTMFNSTEGRWFWVGLNKRDPKSAGAWEWSDGTPVVASFIEDKSDDDESHSCAMYSDLTNTLTPQPCNNKHEWICKVPRGVELTHPYWYNNQNEPWVFYRGAEYFLANQPFPWESVSFACSIMGADLLSIHSKEELNFIRERMGKLPQGSTEWWIGLAANSGTNAFRWTDGTPFDYENWSKEISNKAPQQKCVYMSSVSGEWSPGSCADLHGYVCKRRTVSVVEIPREPHFIGGCPENWFYFGHKCLLLHLPARPEEGKSWRDAESICSNFHGSLVAIESEIEQAYITMLLHGSSAGVWIGLRDEDTMKWTNGKPVTYTNWSPIEPKNYLTQEDWLSEHNIGHEPFCTVLSNNHNFHFTGKWYDEKCTETGYGFVCQKPQDPSKRPSHSYPYPSLDSSEYRNRSYRVVHGNMSWYEALNKCSEKEAELVSITDPFHQAYLTVLVNRLDSPHWIGLYSQDEGINYQWSDGSDTVYSHWDPTDADDDEDFMVGDCVYMDVSGSWRRADCGRPLPGALCHVPPPKSNVISYDVVCPSTWVKFRGSCYNFEPVVQRQSLEAARDHCRQKANSSDVLTIRDEEENRFVLEQLGSYGFPHQMVWLGILYNTDSDVLTWQDGAVLDYTNWHFKAPDTNLVKVDTCVATRVSDGVWHLMPCTDPLGFVCKTSTDSATDVEVQPLNGLHHGVVPAAVLVAMLFFAVLTGSLWFMFKRSSRRFQRLPSLGNAYYRQTGSQASDSDGHVLIADAETQAGE
ncbi:secretory phospholipase A2 receptor [Chanos chanos]|uniref:Secretory phospholipase A2 receptor n=1 Tax=Chanos chanos TaxID=29144 RepID=A0A6J2V7J9_CHACN|nr:secretory phospholipase A2 receptor [Chanos chanos]